MNDVARRLLAAETKDYQNSEALAHAAERVCQRLRAHLSSVLGQDGSFALLNRSMKMAKSKFSSLECLTANPNTGCFEGLSESIQDQEPAATLEVCVGIIGSLIHLLASLVGEDLALKLVEDAFIKSSDDENGTNEVAE